MNTERYDRQIRLQGFGANAQQHLSSSSVLIVGAGGLGVPSALYLNAMGVGKLGIVDGDQVELSNLHRQPLYTPEDTGKLKVDVLSGFLRRQNPETHIEVYDTFLHASNALEIIGKYDLVIDATDNLPTRYLIDDACLIQEIPWIYGALHGFEGQISVLNYESGPTYRCLFPKMPGADEIPDCNQLGTLGILPGIVGNMQALEAIKVICGLDGVLSEKLWLYNALEQNSHTIAFQKDVTMERDNSLDPANYQFVACKEDGALNMEEFLKIFKAREDASLIDVREPTEFQQSSIPGALNIPLLRLESEMAQLPASGPLYLICKSGARSRQAYRYLQTHRPEQEIFWIQGGMRNYNLEPS